MRIDQALQEVKERFGTIDVLVNHAGRGYSGAVEEGDEAAVEELFQTNFFVPVCLIKKVLPAGPASTACRRYHQYFFIRCLNLRDGSRL